MSGVQQRLKLKQTPIDTWSLKEHLALASAVLRSGDQNWVSVSRTMKQFGEVGRPQDWFSQKNCALQYNLLLEKVDTPRRKRGDKVTDLVESPGESIVKKLTAERIEELKSVIEAEKAEIMRLESDTEMLDSPSCEQENIIKILRDVEAEELEEERKEMEHAAWLREREEKKLAIQAALKTGGVRHPRITGQQSLSQSEHSGSEVDSAVDSPAPMEVDGVSEAPATPKAGDGPTTPRMGDSLASPNVRDGPSTPRMGDGPVTPIIGDGQVTLKIGDGSATLRIGDGLITPIARDGPATPRMGDSSPATPKMGDLPATPRIGDGPATPKIGDGPSTPSALESSPLLTSLLQSPTRQVQESWVQSPTKIQSPTKVQSPTKSQSPTKMLLSPTKLQSPTTIQSPVKVFSPATKLFFPENVPAVKMEVKSAEPSVVPVLQEAVTKKEEVITKKKEVLTEKKEDVAEKKEDVTEKKETVTEKKEDVTEKEAVIEKKDAVIEKKEAVVEKEEAVIEKEDAVIEKVVEETVEAEVEKKTVEVVDQKESLGDLKKIESVPDEAMEATVIAEIVDIEPEKEKIEFDEINDDKAIEDAIKLIEDKTVVSPKIEMPLKKMEESEPVSIPINTPTIDDVDAIHPRMKTNKSIDDNKMKLSESQKLKIPLESSPATAAANETVTEDNFQIKTSPATVLKSPASVLKVSGEKTSTEQLKKSSSPDLKVIEDKAPKDQKSALSVLKVPAPVLKSPVPEVSEDKTLKIQTKNSPSPVLKATPAPIIISPSPVLKVAEEKAPKSVGRVLYTPDTKKSNDHKQEPEKDIYDFSDDDDVDDVLKDDPHEVIKSGNDVIIKENIESKEVITEEVDEKVVEDKVKEKLDIEVEEEIADTKDEKIKLLEDPKQDDLSEIIESLADKDEKMNVDIVREVSDDQAKEEAVKKVTSSSPIIPEVKKARREILDEEKPKEEPKEKVKPTYTCDICSKTLSGAYELKRHIRRIHEDEDKKIKVEIIKEVSDDKGKEEAAKKETSSSPIVPEVKKARRGRPRKSECIEETENKTKDTLKSNSPILPTEAKPEQVEVESPTTPVHSSPGIKTANDTSKASELKRKHSEIDSNPEVILETVDEDMADSSPLLNDSVEEAVISEAAASPSAALESLDMEEIARGVDGTESVSSSPVPGSIPDDEKEYRSWKKSIMLVWSQIAQHKNASLFASPVSGADAPDYTDVVFRPMDLGSIKKNIELGHTRTTLEFQRDLVLMFVNAFMYNSSDYEVFDLTSEMQADAQRIVNEYLHTQALVKASGAKMGEEGRGRSMSGASTESTPEEKRKRAGSFVEDVSVKKRRLRGIDESL